MLKKILFVFLSPFLVNGQSAFITNYYPICDNVNNNTVRINFTGTPPFSIVYAIDGVNQPIVPQIFDNPFELPISIEGIYTIVSANDALNVIPNNNIDGSAIVEVLPSPTSVISSDSDTLSVLNPEVNYNTGNSIGNFNASSYQWIFGDGGSESIQNVTHKYPLDSVGLGITAIYQDTLIVTDLNGCSDTAINQIWVRDEYWIYIPNSFTPDYDKKNDKFCIEYHAIRENTFLFKVFNPQGDLMYQSSDPSEMKCSNYGGWDGKHSKTNKDLPLDTYIYELYFQDFEGWKHQEYGEIILVR
jgi:gliding motility-associated-like protein